MHIVSKLALTLIGLASFSFSAQAGPSNWPPAYPARVKTEAQAMDCCKAHAKVALACKDCKTVEAGKNEKGILSWFKADSTHGCSGCGGKVTVKTLGKAGTVASYHHVCSKCGPNSAYVCTDHTKS